MIDRKYVHTLQYSYAYFMDTSNHDADFPTDPFAILEPQTQEISWFYVVHERRATYLKAPKLVKGRSGRVLPSPCIRPS